MAGLRIRLVSFREREARARHSYPQHEGERYRLRREGSPMRRSWFASKTPKARTEKFDGSVDSTVSMNSSLESVPLASKSIVLKLAWSLSSMCGVTEMMRHSAVRRLNLFTVKEYSKARSSRSSGNSASLERHTPIFQHDDGARVE